MIQGLQVQIVKTASSLARVRLCTCIFSKFYQVEVLCIATFLTSFQDASQLLFKIEQLMVEYTRNEQLQLLLVWLVQGRSQNLWHFSTNNQTVRFWCLSLYQRHLTPSRLSKVQDKGRLSSFRDQRKPIFVVFRA